MLVRISCPDRAVAEGLGPVGCESRAHIHGLILLTDTVQIKVVLRCSWCQVLQAHHQGLLEE